MARFSRRLAITVLTFVVALAGCLDLDGYHLEGDGGPDARADGAAD